MTSLTSDCNIPVVLYISTPVTSNLLCLCITVAEKPALGDIQYIETADGEEFSIPEVVGTSYRCFASYLLRDEDGQTVQKLEKKHGENAGDIVFDVLQQWTQGKGRECNWKNLLSGLKACGRKDESEKIKKHLTQC